MISSGEPAGPTYEGMLRKIGAWLDSVSAHRVALREEVAGYLVRYERQDIDTVFLQRFFTRLDVLSLPRGDLSLRRSVIGRIGHRLQGVGGEPGGYQDMFRALGHTLDRRQASDLQLVEDEEHDSLIVTFAIGDTSAPSESLILRRDDREALRRDAHSRRRLHSPAGTPER